ncbi:MAG: LacI family transcriptional regulator [Rhodoglobus sp.]|nr:LacI family transcriptional regulator [Rhodoglobus sp.]
MEVGLREVAALAGVSVGTVSNVVNGRATVAQEYVDRVNDAVMQLGFVRNDAARALRSGTSRTVGMIIPDGNNPFYTSVALGASDAATLNNNIVLVGTSHDEAEREARYVEAFGEQRARGLIIASAGNIHDRLHQFARGGMPSILLDPDVDERFSSVGPDDVLGGRIGVQHLIDTGRRRIGFVGGPMRLRVLTDRLVGANDAISGTNGAVTLEVFETPDRTVLTGRTIGERVLKRPPETRPDALFAMTDLLAIGILQALDAHRVAVPGDISIIGYDDIDFASTTSVPLTSIRQPMEIIGRKAVEMIEAQREGGSKKREHITIEPTLVPRDSTLRP